MTEPAAAVALDTHSLIALLTKVCLSLLHYMNLQHCIIDFFIYGCQLDVFLFTG